MEPLHGPDVGRPAGSIEVRAYRDADFEAVVALWHRAKRLAYPYLPLEQARSLDEDRAFFRGSIAARCRVWVAVERGEVRAFLAMGEGGYVDRLYVDPPHQRRGIGRSLMDHAARISPGGLRLHTHVANGAARTFYEGLGFRAAAFGLSPPPENVPDVEYVWRPAPGAAGVLQAAPPPKAVARVVECAKRAFGERYRSTYLWGSHARGDAIETSDVDVGVFVRGDVTPAARERIERRIEEAVGEPCLDFAVVGESDLDGRAAVSFRYGALRVDGEDLRDAVPLPMREEWIDLADEAALWWITRARGAPLARALAPLRDGDEFLGYVHRTVRVDGRDLPCTKEALTIAGRVATACVARATGRFVGDRPQAVRAYGEDVGGAWAPFLVELQDRLRTRWRYLVPEAAADRGHLRRLCEQTLAFERAFVARLADGPRGPRTERAWREATAAPTR